MISLMVCLVLLLAASSAFKLKPNPVKRLRSISAASTPSQEDSDSRPSFQMKELKTARDKAAFKNKVPFDTDVYEVIRRIIELLGSRIETKAPLSLEDARWLEENLPRILEDADKYGPPPRPVNKPHPSTEGN